MAVYKLSDFACFILTGIVPSVKAISASVLDEDTEYVRLKCVWAYDGNASLVEFHVRWIGNESDPKRQINKKFNGTDKKEYLYEHEYAGKGLFDPPDHHDYAFNNEVCTILYNNLLIYTSIV